MFAAKRRAAAKAKRAIGATSPVVASTLEARAVVAKKKATKAPTAAAIIAFSAYTTTRCGQRALTGLGLRSPKLAPSVLTQIGRAHV